MTDARRLLIRLPNWLGDALMARPLLHALRASLPAAEIRAVGRPLGRVLERERLWDHWTPLQHLDDARKRVLDEDARKRAPCNNRFDAALILPPSFSSAWRLPRRRIPRRIGFAADGRSWLLTDAVHRPAPGEKHLSEEYLDLGARLGVRSAPLPVLRPSEDELAEARARLRRLEVGDRPFVVLGPGAAYGPAKRWPFERFVALARGFTARGFAALIAGAAEDCAITVPMATAIGEGAHSIAGQTSIAEQLALCTIARVTVSNDSGLAHLAAASGAPTVAIFGSTSSAWTAPRGPRVRIVQHPPVCSPCFQRTCAIGYRCLMNVDVGEVAHVCEVLTA
ncbi:MAG TPA: lipopolysaccharide heptosyltransferase II [Candidatus Limnocylindria bacterium]|nr:lipopolysaccharide heptosyltransferase II [Candidatus Limnocylindria bacterium]